MLALTNGLDPLACSGVPEGTKSFARLLFDPEGRAPASVSHIAALLLAPVAKAQLPVTTCNALTMYGWGIADGKLAPSLILAIVS